MAVLPEHAPGEIPLPLRDTMQHTDAMMHSVISFLRRPQLVRSFQFASESRPTDILSKQDGDFMVPRSMFTPMVLNKLDGFTSFRATAVFKLQVNAQPFQCGRLLMAAVPMPGLLRARKDWILKTTTTTQCVNHVQMDIAKQTEVELRVPFISPFNSYNLIDGRFDWAQLVVQVYSPLNNQGGAGELQCLLWGHFEDVVLGAPTSATILSQENDIYSIRQLSGSEGKSERNRYTVVNNYNVAKQQSASPKETKPAVVKKTRALEATSANSPLAASIQSVGSNVIAAGTQVVNGVTGALSGLANLFGWSKPIPTELGRTVLNRPVQFFTNDDGCDHSHVLALDSKNAIEVYNGLAGSNLDELSFDFVKKVPQYIANFKYSVNSKYNEKLWETAVSPCYENPFYYTLKPKVGSTAGPELVNYRQPTSLTYGIAPFAYWTGSLVYTFRFVKTDYHSGRVEISFHPFANKIAEGRYEYVYRTVVDLRENSEVSVTVPFVSPQPWKKIATNVNPIIDIKDKIVDMSINTGLLRVRALTPLICANQIIATEAECLIEVRAGDDFKVQGPTSSSFIPFSFQRNDVIASQQSGCFPKQYSTDVLEKDFGFKISRGKSTNMDGFIVGRKTTFKLTITTEGHSCEFSIGGLGQPIHETTPFNVKVWTKTYEVIPNKVPVFNCIDAVAFVDVNYTLIYSLDKIVLDPSQLPLWVNYYDPSSFASIAPKANDVVTVRIDPSSLPLWVTKYDPSQWEDQTIAKQQSAPVLAVPGTAETRTRAIEGFTPPSITGNESDTHRQDTQQYTAGEIFSNYRQLTRRFGWFLINGIKTGGFTGSVVNHVRPPTIKWGTTGSGDTAQKQFILTDILSNSECINSPLSYIGGMYAFYRGGVRLKTYVKPTRGNLDLVSIAYEYLDNSEISNIGLMQNQFEPIGFELEAKKIGEFQVPYYSPTLITVPWNHDVVAQFDQPQMRYKINTSDFSGSNLAIQLNLAVAAADDFDFQHFIGTPPVLRTANLIDSTGKRVLHYPDRFYSPTQKFIKSGQTGQLSPTWQEISIADLTITEEKPAPAGTVTDVNNIRAKRDLARQAVEQELQVPRPLTRKSGGHLLPLPRVTRSAEIFSSDEGTDEVDSDNEDHRPF